MINLAIVAPDGNANTQTFVRAHKRIKANVFFYYNGFIPIILEGYGMIGIDKTILNSMKSILRTLISINPISLYRSKLNVLEYLFAKSLRKNRVNVVLAEFGTTGVACMKVCRYLDIPLVTHFHGYDCSAYEVLEKYSQKYKEMFEYASSIIAVSHVMERKLVTIGADPSKLLYNPYGPNELFYQVRNSTRKIQFFSVGRFVDKKAPYYTIAAFIQVLAKYPNAKLLMGGEGPLYPTCVNLVRMYGLQDHIHFLGVLTPEEVKKNFDESVAFVQHSITAMNGDMEGTPVGILEASASGLPVISTIHAGIPDVIINNVTGLLVEEHDVDGMAKNMIWVLDNPEKAHEMGERGQKHIKEHFSLDKHLQILTKAVTDAAAKCSINEE